MRERILDAATALLAVLPTAKITMDDIAREAGIVRSTVYKSFKNKEELLNALFAREMRGNHKPVLHDLHANEPRSIKTLVRLFVTQLDLALDYALLDNTFDISKAPTIGEIVLSSQENKECSEEIWLPILQDYEKDGLLRADLDFHETIRWMTYQFVWFINHPRMLTESTDELKHYVEIYVFGAIWHRTA